VIMANPSRTSEEELEAAISELTSHPGIGNAVPSSFREIRRHIAADRPALDGGHTQALSMMIFGSGTCLVCIGHAVESKGASEVDFASAV